MRASVAAWLLLVAGCLAALAVASSASDASGTTGDDTLDTLGSLMQHVRAWSEDRPVAAAAGGVLVIAFFIVVPVPTTPIELSLGYIYGLWLGFVLIYTGKVLGSLGAFTLGRTALRPCCLRRLTRDEMLRAIALAVQREPYRICLLVRAAYMPMFIKNYGLAVLNTPVRPFACALLLVELFKTFELSFLGSAAASLGSSSESDTWRNASLVVACALIVVLAVYGGAVTKRALAEVRRQDAGGVELRDEGGGGAAAAKRAPQHSAHPAPVEARRLL